MISAILGVFFMLALLCALFDLWVSFTKKKIYRLFRKDEERWWFFFYLHKEIPVPIMILNSALRLLDKEVGLERSFIPIQGMQQLCGESLVPVAQVGYRLDNSSGSRLKRQESRRATEAPGVLVTE